jgi:hypothetical protein
MFSQAQVEAKLLERVAEASQRCAGYIAQVEAATQQQQATARQGSRHVAVASLETVVRRWTARRTTFARTFPRGLLL